MSLDKEKLESRYEKMDKNRVSKLERARQCAELTIPGLMPRDGFSQTNDLPVPTQAFAARGVTRLAARLTSAHMPLNDISNFSFYVDDPAAPESNDITDLDIALAQRERRVRRKIASTNARAMLYLINQHLIVMGDVLMHTTRDYQVKMHRLDQYVVRRRPDGQLHELIIQEWVDVETLDPGIQKKVASGSKSALATKREGWEPLYTQVLWNPETSKWDVIRQLREINLDDVPVSYEVSPYRALVWSLVPQEDYGRSLCEEVIGDLRTLDSLSASFNESSAANAEWRGLVDPGGLTEVDDLNESENGEYIPGREEDVHMMQLGSPLHLQTTHQGLTMVKQDLAETFLMNSRRQAERVTATEIRDDAVEVDQALGGVLSAQNREIIPAIVERTTIQMQADGLLEKELDIGTHADASIKIKVKAGLELIAREVNLTRITQLYQAAASVPELNERLNHNDLAKQYVNDLGLDTDHALLTAEQLQARQQVQQQAQQQKMLAEQAVQTGGKVVEAEAQAKGQAQSET